MLNLCPYLLSVSGYASINTHLQRPVRGRSPAPEKTHVTPRAGAMFSTPTNSRTTTARRHLKRPENTPNNAAMNTYLCNEIHPPKVTRGRWTNIIYNLGCVCIMLSRVDSGGFPSILGSFGGRLVLCALLTGALLIYIQLCTTYTCRPTDF